MVRVVTAARVKFEMSFTVALEDILWLSLGGVVVAANVMWEFSESSL